MLKALQIKNFRNFTSFEIPKLGLINLIVGKNNIGKSSILESLRIYAGEANPFLLAQIADERGESVFFEGDCLQVSKNKSRPYERFFKEGIKQISIGDGESSNTLTMEFGFQIEITEEKFSPSGEKFLQTFVRFVKKREEIENTTINSKTFSSAKEVLKITINNDKEQFIPLYEKLSYRYNSRIEYNSLISCSYVRTQLLSDEELAKKWDSVALTDKEQKIYKILKIIEPEIESIACIENNWRKTPVHTPRMPMVKLKCFQYPVPLASLGEGVQKLLQLALFMVSVQNGFLLVDEFEIGLHYSVQSDVWKAIFISAHEMNIQVFVTTHSLDCVKTFMEMAKQYSEINALLIRLGVSQKTSSKGQIIAITNTQDSFDSISDMNLEVR